MRINCGFCGLIAKFTAELYGEGEMDEVRGTTLARVLCAAILLLYAASFACGANQQQKTSDAQVRRGGRGERRTDAGRPARPVESWAVGVGGEPGNAEYLARKHGLTNRGQIGNLKGVYLLTAPAAAATETISSAGFGETPATKIAALKEDKMVMFVEPQQVQLREKRGYQPPHDPGWKKQWSLLNSGQTTGPTGLDLNVEPVWLQGINGSSVVVGIVDDGLEWTHTDLIDNYDSEASYDFVWEDRDPTPDENDEEPNSHGTGCAGEVAMGRDCSCGVGVAYGCSIGGLKVDFDSITDSTEARALGHQNSLIDVYSNSWGPSDYGFSVEGPGTLLRQTLATGAQEGRDGKGSIYVWAAGNGGKYFDSCAADGYVNSIYTIAVGSADQNGRPADYDEACSAKMAVTFSYNSETFPPAGESWKAHNQVFTTTLGGECTDSFTGTSASSPLVSGVLALTLQTNPNLTWRDVQYLIAYTSNPDILTVDDLATNGAGLKFSHHFGFGAIDAEAMVTRARHWTNVPEQKTTHIPIRSQTKTIYTSDKVSFTVSGDDIVFLEHVVVALTLEVHDYGKEYDYNDFYDELYSDDSGDIYNWLQLEHPCRGDVEIELVSPSGTRSTLLLYRDYDFINTEGYHNWPFMSVHFWGESPIGSWTLHTTYRSSAGHLAMKDVSMTMYGVGEVPVSVSSTPSSCHSACVRGCSGGGAESCGACKNLRLLSTLECVDHCPNGTRPYNKYCITDSGDDVVDSVQCPGSEGESGVDTTNVGLGVVAVVLFVAVVLAVVGVGLVRYRRGKAQNRFRRLFNATAAVNS